jgi:putative membrane protein
LRNSATQIGVSPTEGQTDFAREFSAMKLSLIAGVLALAMASAGTASATEVLGMGTPSAEQFRNKAASSDAFEIVSSKMAQTHATDPQIKDFAAMMIRDHTASTDKLVALGGISKASIDTKMQPGKDGKYEGNDLLSTTQAAELNSLNAKSNADFDQTYMEDQVKGHKDAVALMEDYAKDGDNAKLKAFAAEVLPTIKEHLAMAQKIEARINSKKKTM